MNCKPYLDYKESGVQWLGEVPEGWEALSLRRLIKYVKTGTTPSGAEEYHFEDGGFNWYSPSDFSDAVYLGAANRALSAEGKAEVRIFPKMTVMLVGIGATIGKVGLAANESSCNQQINAIICNGKLDPIFATYSLKTMRDFIVTCGKFTTMPIINQDETKNLILAVPPIFEQTAIADFLDRETGRIDTLMAKKRRLIALLGEKRTALISRTVTRGLPADAAREFGLESHTRFKDSGIEWLGEVPDGWAVKKLGHLSVIVRGGSPRPAGDPRYFDGDHIPWITVGEVTKDTNVFLETTETMLTKEGASCSRTIKSGTLIITNSGATLGVPKILKITGCANDGIVAFEEVSNKTDIYFLYYFLSSLTNDLRNRLKQGGGQPNLNTDLIKAIAAPFPNKSEQTAIATYLDRETAKIDQLVAKVEAAIARLQEYRTALITAAVTGKIDVREVV